MQEVEMKDNKSGYSVFVDDLPIKELIPKEQIDIFVNAMAIEICEIIKSKQKRKQYYENSKRQSSLKKVPP